MKNRMTFLMIATALILLAPQLGWTQTRPFNGANKIIAKFNMTNDSLMQKVVSYFADKGYSVEAVDKGNGVIQTGVKSPVKSLVSVKINAQIKDNTIIFTGLRKSKYTIGVQTGAFREITCGGIYSSEQKDAWDELDKMVKGFKPSNIVYVKN
jgi:hypothetical protein